MLNLQIVPHPDLEQRLANAEDAPLFAHLRTAQTCSDLLNDYRSRRDWLS